MTRGTAIDTVDGLSPADRADARTWMQAARAWTIERHPYLDTALSSMLLVERPGLGTVAVDARWRLYYDPERVLVLVKAHGIAVLASDWVHEVMHVLRDHLDRWESLGEPPGRQPLFNVAGDALVNADVDDLDLPILDTDVTFDRLPPQARSTRTMTTEEVYQRLLRTGVVVESSRADCGSGAGGSQRPWEDALEGEPEDGSADEGRAAVIREETARGIRASRRSGDIPATLALWAEAFLDPSVDWRAELRSVVSRRLGLAAGVTDYSFTRPSRRRVPGFSLPGMVGPLPPTVAAVVDTSGSMTRGELAQCLGDLLGLVRAVTGGQAAVTVVQCDATVLSASQVRSQPDVLGMQLVGGGGTDMGAGLSACGALRPRPDAVVVMTDGHTPWPDEPPDGLASATVVALLSAPGTAPRVPAWIRVISVGN
ncbi:MAG: vWA domain-containing protein [Candidatus Nanopelagicales bacterium]